MTIRKDLAVVILNYNGVNVLPEYLPSVLDYSDEADVIIVDNASTDDSLSIIKEYNCECIQFDENLGFAGGYNKALQQLDYRYVLLLNSDVRVTSGWLGPLVEAIESDEKLASVMPIIRADRKPTHYEYAGAAGGFWDSLGYPYCRGRILSQVEELNQDYASSMPVYWSSGAAILVRREHFVKTGGFDESFFAHQEEIDWCWRVKNQGYYHMVIHESEVYHLGGGTLDYSSPRKTYLNFRNNISTIIKNKKSSLWSTLLFRFILDAIASITMISRPKQSWAVWKAWYFIIVHFRTLRSSRKELKSSWSDPHISYSELKYNRLSILISYYIQSKRTFDQL